MLYIGLAKKSRRLRLFPYNDETICLKIAGMVSNTIIKSDIVDLDMVVCRSTADTPLCCILKLKTTLKYY